MKLSVTRLNTLSFCPRSHYYGYTLDLEPKVAADALSLGKLVHSGIEEFYRTGTMPMIDDDGGEVTQKARSALSTYGLLAKMQDNFTVVDVEKQFETDVEGHRFVGVIDAVVRLQGELWLLEHKTCSQHWNDLQLGLAPQHQLYELAAEELYGEPVRGTMYNFLRITKRGGEFHTDAKRVTIPASEHARTAAWEDMIFKLSLMDMGANYRNSGQHCGWCRFSTLCQSDYVGGDTQYLIDQHFQKRSKDDDTSD